MIRSGPSTVRRGDQVPRNVRRMPTVDLAFVTMIAALLSMVLMVAHVILKVIAMLNFQSAVLIYVSTNGVDRVLLVTNVTHHKHAGMGGVVSICNKTRNSNFAINFYVIVLFALQGSASGRKQTLNT